MLSHKSVVLIIFTLIKLMRAKEFKFYWNIPTFMCEQYGITFTHVQEFGIIQNFNDSFRGEKVSILYDPGKFPALLEEKTGGLFQRNGGVPQEGNLDDHLKVFREHLDMLIPDPGNEGLIIIDFESWRPILRQNFGSLQPYKDLSFKIERKLHPFWLKPRLEAEANSRFNKNGRVFMEETIKLGKQLRPAAQWGYYAFPYCFNGNTNNVENCAKEVIPENNQINWLFEKSDIILPSVYLKEQLPQENRARMVRGRVKEALRMAQRVNKSTKPPVITYIRHAYTDTRNNLSYKDLYEAISVMQSQGGHGVIFWGSSNDLNTKLKCKHFYNYVESVIKPIVTSLQPRQIVLLQQFNDLLL